MLVSPSGIQAVVPAVWSRAQRLIAGPSEPDLVARTAPRNAETRASRHRSPSPNLARQTLFPRGYLAASLLAFEAGFQPVFATRKEARSGAGFP